MKKRPPEFQADSDARLKGAATQAASVAGRGPSFGAWSLGHERLPLALGALHTALIGIAAALLAWQLGSLTGVHALIALLALGVAALAVVAARRGHIAHLELCMLEASALATASATLGAWTLHLVFKPAAMLFALLFIASSAYSVRAVSTPSATKIQCTESG